MLAQCSSGGSLSVRKQLPQRSASLQEEGTGERGTKGKSKCRKSKIV